MHLLSAALLPVSTGCECLARTIVQLLRVAAGLSSSICIRLLLVVHIAVMHTAVLLA
jgi:hypothetical protein